MSSPVSPVTSVQHDASPVQVQAKPPQQKPQTTNNDTVEISSAAKAARTAAEERTESHAETAREAARGDQQAQRLLNAQQAAAKAYKKK